MQNQICSGNRDYVGVYRVLGFMNVGFMGCMGVGFMGCRV